MIANPIKGSHFKGIFDYHEKKINEGVAHEIGRTIGLAGMDKSAIIGDFNSLVSDYKSNQVKGRKLEKFTFHPNIDFAKEDLSKLTDDLLNEIADRYMKMMGYGNCEYVVYRHMDKDHPHIHIASSVVDVDGKKVDDSFEVEKSLRLCRMFEKEYGITIATDRKRDHKKEIDRHGPEIDKIKEGNTEDLELKYGYGAEMLINIAIENALCSASVVDFETFTKVLEKEGVKPVKIEKEGKVIGLKYSVLDPVDSKRSMFSIKASATKKRATLKNLDSHFAKNIGDNKEYVRKSINKAFARGVKDLIALKQQLHLDNVELKPVENSGGIYGVSFGFNGQTFKGSDLGKEYSFRNLSSRFSGVGNSGDSISKKDTPEEKRKQKVSRGQVSSKLFIRGAIDEAIQKASNVSELEQILVLKGINVVKAENSGGVYGLSFQLKNGKIYKGSELGKQYSIKAIEKRFNRSNKDLLLDAIKAFDRRGDINTLLIQLSRKGFEYNLTNGSFYHYNFPDDAIPLKEVMGEGGLKEFTISNFIGISNLDRKVLGALQSQQRVAPSCTKLESFLIAALYSGDVVKASKMINRGAAIRVHEREVHLLDKETLDITTTGRFKYLVETIDKKGSMEGKITELYLSGVKFNGPSLSVDNLPLSISNCDEANRLIQIAKTKGDFISRLNILNLDEEESKLMRAVFAFNHSQSTGKDRLGAKITIANLIAKGVSLKFEEEVLNGLNSDTKALLDSLKPLIKTVASSESLSKGQSQPSLPGILPGMFGGPAGKKKKKEEEEENRGHGLGR
ncbi:relaxase/mobilization nuclease domain-containing protein [Xanthovirga aplysinae]|uniref:relaxase/mobilization nuclease domain-containing protein n=1 Tax=Xanthovirga aplysinae TaxID=2529853 RepID=UPI0012BCB5BC|nr:relaxase/mobilization nuclease domain-containing protein [Xanthovirga aplysinae]MTI30028.1 hypothetical protein [Xanthovirga aplysinae]